MKTTIILLLLSCFYYMPISGQHKLQDIDSENLSDASIFESAIDQKASAYQPYKRIIALTDSTFLTSARVLMNLDADAYKMTFSLSQEALTIKSCHEIMDQRILEFIQSIESLGINKDNISIDRTGQYPVYGYDIERKTATQILEGYEVNRNIIIRFDSIETSNKLISIAANLGIHDAVKMEYIMMDIEPIYEALFSEALTIINKKKELYLRATNLRIKDEAMVYSEQFQFVFPNQRYKKYQAFLSSEVKNNNYRTRIREEERKKTTWYYDGLSFSGFDKVIRPEKVRVGLQAVFELVLKYEKLE